MAIRRSYGSHERELDMADEDYNQPVGTSIEDLSALFGGDGAFSGGEPAQPAMPDRSQSVAAAPSGAPMTGDEGNRERPREVFGDNAARTPVGGINIDDIMAMLPQGVEAQPAQQPSVEASGMGAESTPMSPQAPTPSVTRQQPPMMAGNAEAGASAGGPRRNTFSSPSALFAGGGQQALGRVGGGGFGLPGQSQGPPQATKQMLELLKQLQNVGV